MVPVDKSPSHHQMWCDDCGRRHRPDLREPRFWIASGLPTIHPGSYRAQHYSWRSVCAGSMVMTRAPGMALAIAATVSKKSEEHTSELQSPDHLVCRLLLEKKKKTLKPITRE